MYLARWWNVPYRRNGYGIATEAVGVYGLKYAVIAFGRVGDLLGWSLRRLASAMVARASVRSAWVALGKPMNPQIGQ